MIIVYKQLLTKEHTNRERTEVSELLLVLYFTYLIQLGMDLQPKLSLRRQLMGLNPKYNGIGLGRGMSWYAGA